MSKYRAQALDLIARSNPYWKPIWLKRVPKGRKLTKALTTIVGRQAELEAELKDLKVKLKVTCTHPRDAQAVFEWSVRCWEVRCTICNQIVNNWEKEKKRKKRKK